MSKSRKFTFYSVALVVLLTTAFGAYASRDHWMKYFHKDSPESSEHEETPVEEPKVLKLSPQARKNLGLISKPIIPQSYWKKIQIPGMVVDRPGYTDRGVTTPIEGVISEIHAFPGDTVKSGDRLFTVRLFSEYLQNTQKELYKATREIQLINEQLERLSPLAESGGIAKSKIIDLKNQLRRQNAEIQAHTQDLQTRGLTKNQISNVSQGDFVTSIEISAPSQSKNKDLNKSSGSTNERKSENQFSELLYEVQELSAELGQQVQAGQLLATLANHGLLYIEGHAFKQEAPALENAAQNKWPIVVEFAEDNPKGWPDMNQGFFIRHLANKIDTESRTFEFFIPLKNQSRTYQQENQTFVVWRFRPGQRVRLHVPVEKYENVIVLPSSGVIREGPEAYVFRQNGDLFNRIPVHVLYEDRVNIVVANDGSVSPGLYLAQNSAASLNRVLKAQAASGMRADVHVHADGTVHAAH